MIELDDGTVISEAEHVAGIVNGTAETNGLSATRGTSVRLPIFLLARLDAYAGVSGKTRNFIIERMLEVGMEETSKHLDDDVLQNCMICFRTTCATNSTTSFKGNNHADFARNTARGRHDCRGKDKEGKQNPERPVLQIETTDNRGLVKMDTITVPYRCVQGQGRPKGQHCRAHVGNRFYRLFGVCRMRALHCGMRMQPLCWL